MAELCLREGGAGKRRLAGDTARAATSDEVKALGRAAQGLKEVVAEVELQLKNLHRSGSNGQLHRPDFANSAGME